MFGKLIDDMNNATILGGYLDAIIQILPLKKLRPLEG